MNSLDLKIENALSAGTISIWYQPIYNRETNTFDAAEALMRLYDGEKMLPTFAAICRMEETGEIVRAGELVFEKVCCFINLIRKRRPFRGVFNHPWLAIY